jgi:hypothetical protein
MFICRAKMTRVKIAKKAVPEASQLLSSQPHECEQKDMIVGRRAAAACWAAISRTCKQTERDQSAARGGANAGVRTRTKGDCGANLLVEVQARGRHALLALVFAADHLLGDLRIQSPVR